MGSTWASLEGISRVEIDTVRKDLQRRLDLVDEPLEAEGGRYTRLLFAAIVGRHDIISAVLKRKPDAIKQVTGDGENILHLLAKHNQYQPFQSLVMADDHDLRELLRKFAKRTDAAENTVLHLSVVGTSTELLNLILSERLVGVNVVNMERKTALHLAIEMGFREEMVAALRNAGGVTVSAYGTGEQLNGVLNTTVVAAIVIASLAFSTMLNPPGGVYQDGPMAGQAILSTHPLFHAFLVFNVATLIASLSIVVMESRSVTFEPDRLKARRIALKVFVAVSFLCISLDYLIAVWMIYWRGSVKMPFAIILLSTLVGFFILSTSIIQVYGIQSIWMFS